MAKKNIKKIFLGIFLVFLALASGLAAFYYIEVKPELAARIQEDTTVHTDDVKVQERLQEVQREVAQQKAQNAPAQPETTKASAPLQVTQASEVKPVQNNEKEISLNSLISKAETVYSDEEKSRKDGFLWVDRKSARLVVTLGAINGLAPGSYLTVYDGDQPIGQVKVEIPFDVISYVQPLDRSLDQFTSNYYKVTIE